MESELVLSLYQAIGLSVGIATSLIIGLSLVEVNVNLFFKKICITSLIFGFLFRYLQLLIDYDILFIIIYLSLIPILISIFKISFSQGTIAVLLAFIYDLTVIKLFSYNLFNIALMNTNIDSDPMINIALSAFVMLSNVFIALLIFRRAPVLFPKRWLDSEYGDVDTPGQKFHLVFIILILSLLSIFLYYTYTELNFFRPSYRIFVTFWSIVTCILMLYFARKIVITSMERVQFSLDKAYQKDILKFYNMIRSQRHDFNIHLNAISGLIQQEKYDACNTYIEEIIGEAKFINDLLPLHHPATAAMLSTLKLDAMQKGITINFLLEDNLKDMPCTIYETNKILGNLINNAIEDVQQQNDSHASVDVVITKEFNSIILRITNKTNASIEQLQQIFDLGFSTKPAHEGIGLPTINNIISNYSGVLYPEIDEGSITMNVRIPLLSV